MNRPMQEKMARGLFENKYTALFIDSKGKVFGYYKKGKVMLSDTEPYYTILIEHSDNENMYFKIAVDFVDNKISKLDESLGNLGIYTGYYEGEFEHEIYEIK